MRHCKSETARLRAGIQPMLDGLVILDKPPGMTSAAAVNRVKRLLPRGTKIGHAGTLDPFATGVLALLVGKATKLCERLMNQPKQYEATIKLGATTETDDLDSPERITASARPVDRAQIESMLPRFIGAIEQIPPVFSALKIAGKRACDRTRAGEQLEMKSRIVQIYGIDLLRFEWPELDLRIDCGRGTYIRSLARDIGQELGAGGYLLRLRRTRVGACHLSNSVTLENLTYEKVAAAVTESSRILHQLPPPL